MNQNTNTEAVTQTDRIIQIDEQTLAKIQELAVVMGAMRDATTPEIVQGMVGSIVKIVTIADQMNQPSTKKLIDFFLANSETVEQLFERIVRIEQSGFLERIEKLLPVMGAVLDSITPEILVSLLHSIVQMMELLDGVLQSSLMKKLPMIISEFDRNLQQDEQKHKGLFQMMKEIREPEVQEGLNIVFKLLKSVGNNMTQSDQTQIASGK